MKRIMAIDYGDARTGIAISDLLCSLVGSTTVIHSRVPEKTVAEICRLARENQVEELVMGFPRNMDGTEGPRAELYRDDIAVAVIPQDGAVPGLCPAAGGGLRPDGSPVGRAPDHHRSPSNSF